MGHTVLPSESSAGQTASASADQFNQDYYYGSIYQDYDTFLNWEKIATDILQRFHFDSFLDIGCGCGNLVKIIKADKGADADIAGVDFSEFAVARAAVPFVSVADCRALPFTDRRFDMVFILGPFSYLASVSQVRKALREAYRVAKRVILFDDVYVWPAQTGDDYDPYRKQVLTQSEWLALWREVSVSDSRDEINTNGDEIIITKYGL